MLLKPAKTGNGATRNVMTNSMFPQMLTSKLRDYYILTKPEVNLLILMTTSAGYYLGNHGPLKIGGLVSTLVGTLLVASGTATLNQWMERVWDAQMRRTASRPRIVVAIHECDGEKVGELPKEENGKEKPGAPVEGCGCSGPANQRGHSAWKCS